MAGLIDPAAELDRLAKRLRKAEGELEKLQAKLAKPEFAENAPPEVVAKDTLRRTELRTEIGQLRAQIAGG
jgi:valyl-tRNA synthetase